VSELEALKTVTAFGFFTDDVENGVDKFSAFSVVTLGPVVASAGLAENKVVGTEELSVHAGADGIHGAGLEIQENGSWNVLAFVCVIVVDIDSLQLEFRLAIVGTSGVDSMLIRNNFPKLCSNLVSALSSLNVNDLPHFDLVLKKNIPTAKKIHKKLTYFFLDVKNLKNFFF